jgi:hypothetical protein
MSVRQSAARFGTVVVVAIGGILAAAIAVVVLVAILAWLVIIGMTIRELILPGRDPPATSIVASAQDSRGHISTNAGHHGTR